MKYPTKEEIEKADRIQLAKWYRFLDSPGIHAAGDSNFQEVLDYESLLMMRIEERFKELGGMTPKISKLIGW